MIFRVADALLSALDFVAAPAPMCGWLKRALSLPPNSALDRQVVGARVIVKLPDEARYAAGGHAGLSAIPGARATRASPTHIAIAMMPALSRNDLATNRCPDGHKWAILEREPLPPRSDGRIVILGDACHPMTPYMAQDAASLARCLAAVDNDDLEGAFRHCEANRKPRTSRIQAISSANTWRSGGKHDLSVALRLRRVKRTAGKG